MKKAIPIFLLLPLLLFTTSTFAEGIKFFKGSFEEALELAKAEEKLIFVDAYTTWCGPCKRMSANVFPQEEVGNFFNANFISMKIDMEKPDGIKFRQTYPVSAFPTFYFIADDGKTVHTTKGAQKADAFIKLGKMVVGKFDRSSDFAKEYDAGNREPELILKYVKALIKSNKPSGKIANEYLNSQKDLNTDFNRRFLLAATTEADSRIFDKMVAQREAISALESKEAVDAKIEKACQNTVEKAIEFKSEDLLDEAKSKMKKYLSAKSSDFNYQSDMAYYKAEANSAKYLKTCATYVKKKVKGNAAELHKVSKDIFTSFSNNEKAMSLAEKYAKQAVENGGLAKYYATYASLLYANGKKDEAMTMAQKAVEMAKANSNEQMEAVKVIRMIQREK